MYNILAQDYWLLITAFTYSMAIVKNYRPVTKCRRSETLTKSLYRVFGRETFGKLSKCSITFNLLTTLGREKFGKLMDNRQCFPANTLYYIQ